MTGNGATREVRQPLAARADIDHLLRAFYERVFEDELLGHVFVDVAGMDLDAHLPVLGGFWEKVLFNTGVYSGQMMDVHRRVNELETFTPAHFARWLAVWEETVDARFDGPVADQAKAHAARIAHAMQRALTSGMARSVPSAWTSGSRTCRGN